MRTMSFSVFFRRFMDTIASALSRQYVPFCMHYASDKPSLPRRPTRRRPIPQASEFLVGATLGISHCRPLNVLLSKVPDFFFSLFTFVEHCEPCHVATLSYGMHSFPIRLWSLISSLLTSFSSLSHSCSIHMLLIDKHGRFQRL